MPNTSRPELPPHPRCPHCGSEDTELMSMFGTVLANAQYYCNACSTAFELMKWRDEASRGDDEAA